MAKQKDSKSCAVYDPSKDRLQARPSGPAPVIDKCSACGSLNVVVDISDSSYRMCMDCKHTYMPEKVTSDVVKRLIAKVQTL